MTGGDIASIFQGAIVTITLSLIGILIGLPIGLGLALLRWANVPVVARIVAVYVSMLRATPLVTLLLLLFFALPNIGIPINPISAAITALVRAYRMTSSASDALTDEQAGELRMLHRLRKAFRGRYDGQAPRRRLRSSRKPLYPWEVFSAPLPSSPVPATPTIPDPLP